MRESKCIEKTKLDTFISAYIKEKGGDERVMLLRSIFAARGISFLDNEICYVDLSMAADKLKQYDFNQHGQLLGEWICLMEREKLINECRYLIDGESLTVDFFDQSRRLSLVSYSTRSSIVGFFDQSFAGSTDIVEEKTNHVVNVKPTIG